MKSMIDASQTYNIKLSLSTMSFLPIGSAGGGTRTPTPESTSS